MMKTQIPLLQHLPEPCWRYFNACELAEIPTPFRSFLSDPGSMTARLRQENPSFGLQVLSEEFTNPTFSERTQLAMQEEESAFIRESVLYSDQSVWMYGRLVFPLATLTDKEQAFTALGNRPIGDVLFSDPRVKRGAFDFANMKIKKDLYWIRRSIFFVEQKKILLTEFFLPNVFQLGEAGKSKTQKSQ